MGGIPGYLELKEYAKIHNMAPAAVRVYLRAGRLKGVTFGGGSNGGRYLIAANEPIPERYIKGPRRICPTCKKVSMVRDKETKYWYCERGCVGDVMAPEKPSKNVSDI